jgi:hypothetical protein
MCFKWVGQCACGMLLGAQNRAPNKRLEIIASHTVLCLRTASSVLPLVCIVYVRENSCADMPSHHALPIRTGLALQSSHKLSGNTG